LSKVSCPVLVVGPHVDPEWRPISPRLIACAEPGWDADAAIGEMIRWQSTFEGPTPWVVEVVEPDARTPDGAPEESLLLRTADRLAQSGVRVDWEVVHDDEPVDGLLRFAESATDAIFLATTERWADPAHVHAHSVSRQLAHRSPRPVLVVPHACNMAI
jgi:nucleotide-binding universal stress UspA family protein